MVAGDTNADAQLLDNVLCWVEKGLDFADALHLAHSQEATTLYTFAQRFSKRSEGLGEK